MDTASLTTFIAQQDPERIVVPVDQPAVLVSWVLDRTDPGAPMFRFEVTASTHPGTPDRADGLASLLYALTLALSQGTVLPATVPTDGGA